MENDKRIMISLALIAVIAVAAIGIGYAYTATTENTNNYANTEYVTIIQANVDSGDGAYTFADSGEVKIYWNADDSMGSSKPETKFTLDSTVDDVVSGYALVKVGDSFVLKTAPQNDGTYKDTLTCSVVGTDMPLPTITTVSDNAPDKQAVLFLVVETNNSAEIPATQKTVFMLTANNTFDKETDTDGYDDGNQFTIYKNNAGTAYNDVTVSMYYGYSGTAESGITVPHEIGTQPAGPSQSPLSGSGLKFSISVTPS